MQKGFVVLLVCFMATGVFAGPRQSVIVLSHSYFEDDGLPSIKLRLLLSGKKRVKCDFFDDKSNKFSRKARYVDSGVYKVSLFGKRKFHLDKIRCFKSG